MSEVKESVRETVGPALRQNVRLEQAASTTFLLVLVIAVGSLAPGFLSVENFLSIARVVSITGIIAAGMTLAVISGGIDLSVGATAGLGGVVAAGLMAGSNGTPTLGGFGDLPVPVAVGAGLLVGAIVGLLNGLIITKTGIEPFMATLGMMIFVRGLIYLFTGGYPVLFQGMPPEFAWLGQGDMFGIPSQVAIFALIVLLIWWISKKTALGREIYAVGGNEEASRLSGIHVKRTKILLYVIIGFLAALAGIILVSRLGSAGPNDGMGFEFTAIAGVVIGGTSLAGGRGSVLGSVVGVFVIGILQNALTLVGAATEIQYVAIGMVLLFAISVDGFIRNRKRA